MKNSITFSRNKKKILIINPNKSLGIKNFSLKKNFSSTTTRAMKYNYINANIKNSKSKPTISLFIENNPLHYRLPSVKNPKLNIKVLDDRKYMNKRLMDSISNFAKKKKLNSDDYNSCVSNLMTKYSYSNPEAENGRSINYELTRTKIKFYNEKKKKIENFLKKSKSMCKYNINESKYTNNNDDAENEKNTMINVKNIEYIDPVDSLGLLLRNKIVHDKILLNYQDLQVQDYGQKINKFNDISKIEILSKKVKITSIIPSILNNNDNSNYMGVNSDQKVINPNETKKYNNNSKFTNKIMEKANFLDINDLAKGSINLSCGFFRPSNYFPESREEFCMNYDELTNMIYLFGGNSSNINSHQFWKFNLSNNTWTNITSSIMPEPRRGHSGVIYKNKYYIFGGKYINNQGFARLDIFDFNTNSWVNNYYNYFLYKLRRNHIACLIGPHMLIHGGVDENGEILDDSYLLNLNSNLIWSKTSIMPILIPPKLAYHSCCLVITSDIKYNNKFSIYKIPNSFFAKKLNSKIKEMGMYVFGGKNKTICNDMWLLKIGKKPLEWMKVFTVGAPPCPRYLCSMNFYEKGNFIIIHGGKTKITEESFALSDTYLFDLYRYHWLRVDYGDKDNIVKKRCSHCSVICENKLFIFGGINDGTFNGSKFFVINLDINKGKINLDKGGKKNMNKQ